MRQRIRTTIINCLKLYKPGERISTDYVVTQCRKYISRTIDSGTIRREMRYLKQDGIINYKYIGPKKDKIIQIIKIDS